jgi:hypothetical protein
MAIIIFAVIILLPLFLSLLLAPDGDDPRNEAEREWIESRRGIR